MSSADPTSSNDQRRKCAAFVHTPLDATAQVRLLELRPSVAQSPGDQLQLPVSDDFSRPIRCSILTTSIDNPPPYHALSYCWGEGKPSHSVDIDGAVLSITASLDSALRHLRHKEETVMLWIDQICINQGDNHEKSEQVKMMPRIYSMAKQVLVWLGPAGQGSDDAMDFYAKVGEAIRERGLQHYCSSEMMPLLGAAVQTEDPGDQLWQKLNTVQTLARQLLLPRLQAMVDWDRRPWFGRVWVVQEFCFGADPVFVCGDKRLAADHVKTTRLLLGLGITADFVEAVRNFGPDKLLLLETLADDPTTAFFGARTWRQRYEGGRPYPDNVMLELL